MKPTFFASHYTKLIACFFVLISLALNSHAIELTPHKAFYKSNIKKGIKIKGSAVRELKKISDTTWLYRFSVESFAADIAESVTFEWANQKVRPQKYDYLLSGLFIKDKFQKVKFDWKNLSANGQHNKNQWSLPLEDNSLDRLGYQLQLLVDVALQTEAKTPALMEYNIVHRGKHRPSTFEIVDTEPLKTKQGEWQTIKVIKKRDEDKKRETTLWFSTRYPFLLMKMIQIEKDGERYELNLDSAETAGNKIY